MISRKSLYKLFNGTCFYCQKPITYDESTRDHFIPKIRGGSNRKDNIVLSCGPCNRDKGAETNLDKVRFRKLLALDTSVDSVHSEDMENEITCLDCQDTGVIEHDDDYNGSGELVSAGRTVKCHCQIEDGENEEN